MPRGRPNWVPGAPLAFPEGDDAGAGVGTDGLGGIRGMCSDVGFVEDEDHDDDDADGRLACTCFHCQACP